MPRRSRRPWMPLMGMALTDLDLERFEGGLTWPQILEAVTPGRPSRWWPHAVAQAEAEGRLEWNRTAKTWRRTHVGRRAQNVG